MTNVINLQEKRDQSDEKNNRISEVIDNITMLSVDVYNNLANANPHLNIPAIDPNLAPLPLNDGLFNLSAAIVIDSARNNAKEFYEEAIFLLGHEQALLAACSIVGKEGLHNAFEEICAFQ